MFQDLIVMRDAFNILLPKVSVDSDDCRFQVFCFFSVIKARVTVSFVHIYNTGKHSFHITFETIYK